MRTILVTGAAGFIGARTSEMLLQSGDRVVGIDNMNDYYDVRVKDHRAGALRGNPAFTFERGDIEHLDTMERIFREHKFDAVINLAARAGVRYSIENPFVYMNTNATGTLNLLEMMKRHGVKKMVLASTSSLYAGQPVPFKEDLPVNTPISPYAATKKAAEAMAYTYHYLHGLDISVLRYFTVYGPAGRPDMSIFRFIKWIDNGVPLTVLGDGSQTRDFTYIDDIASGTLLALKPLGYEVINLGGGKDPQPLSYLISTVERLLGKKATIENRPFHKADMTETMADITKARAILGWEPKTDLDTGLEETVRWYIANREWTSTVLD